MSTKTRLACAALLFIASSAPVMAEQWQIDRSGDSVYYYGPVQQQQRAHAAPVTEHHQGWYVETPRMDTSGDHVYYYGPVK
jgi:hypothetical protein